METVEDDAVAQRVEPLGGALDLGDAGQEGEHAARLFAQRACGSRRRSHPRSALPRPRPRWRSVERIAPALALDHRRIAHQRREARAVERRRHRHEAQIGPQRALRVERQREPEIAVEAALVHLVEQHRRNAGQLGIGLDAVDEDALGHDRARASPPIACCPSASRSRRSCRPARRPARPSARRRRVRRAGAATAAGSRRCTRPRRATRARPPSSCPRPAARRARRSIRARSAASRSGRTAWMGRAAGIGLNYRVASALGSRSRPCRVIMGICGRR